MGLAESGKSVAGKLKGSIGEGRPHYSQVPQRLLVQGAVEAVNLFLAVFLDGIQGGTAAHYLQNIAAGSRGAHRLASVS